MEQIEVYIKMLQRNIKKIREAHNESITELAAATGQDAASISRYEHFERTPTFIFLMRFCTHYQISLDDAVGFALVPEQTSYFNLFKKITKLNTEELQQLLVTLDVIVAHRQRKNTIASIVDDEDLG